jgi:hypothetical protein
MCLHAQAELKPAAFAFWLGFHCRIIPDRGQLEQGILAAGRGRVAAIGTRHAMLALIG